MTRFVLHARGVFLLPWELSLSARAELVATRYGDAVPVGQKPMTGTLVSIEDESRSTLRIELARPVATAVEAGLLGFAAGSFIYVAAADVQEVRLPRETPPAYARRLARDKARAVPGALVLGADTIVVVDDEVLEKPADPAHALAMLRRLQGRRHEVVTAVCLIANGQTHEAQDITAVFFRAADDATLRAYIATGEPMDKAGAYGIQGFGAALVDRIEGDFFSVMGLPVRLVLDLLARAGTPYEFPSEPENAATSPRGAAG